MSAHLRAPLSLVMVVLLVLSSLSLGMPAQVRAQTGERASVVSENPAQIVVMDTSGSMNDSDSGGGTKLDGAKSTIAEYFRKVPGRSELGVWTYPSSSGSCSPGGYLRGAELKSVIDPTSLTADVAALRANGDTPTAEALRAVADDLERAGKKSATIVLVSDGESTCGDPCEMAEELVNDGFLVTVHGVGFNISDAGREELECISAATDGSYSDVANSDELFDLLAITQQQQLDVELSVPGSTPSGASLTAVTTTVNQSDQVLTDVRLSLTGKASEELSGFFPAIVPPRVSLGNIEPGGTRTYEWTLGLPAAGNPGHMRLKATAVASNALPAHDLSEVRVSGEQLTLDDAGPIIKELGDSPHPVVVLGDSFSSGEGEGPYQETGGGYAEQCHRSSEQYAHHLFGPDRVRLLACSGAVGHDLFKPQYASDSPPGASPIVDTGQLIKLDQGPAPSGVMLTIGGNDIGFAEVLRECAVAVSCAAWPHFTSKIHKRVSDLDLAGTYTEVYRRANTESMIRDRSGATAPVLVLAYPLLYPYAGSRKCGGLSQGELKFGTDLGHRLNRKLQAEVDKARKLGAEVHFVSDVEQAFQPDHTMCDTDSFVVPAGVVETINRTSAEAMTDLEGLVQEQAHPTSEGHRAMAGRVLQWSTRVTDRSGEWNQSKLKKPAAPAAPKPLGWGDGGWLTFMLDGAGTALGWTGKAIVEGSAPRIMTGPYMVYLHSDPSAVTRGYAGEDGESRFGFEIPPGTEPGRHTVVLEGFDAQGQPVTVEQGLTLMASPPRWSPILLVAVVAMWIAAGAYAARARRENR